MPCIQLLSLSSLLLHGSGGVAFDIVASFIALGPSTALENCFAAAKPQQTWRGHDPTPNPASSLFPLRPTSLADYRHSSNTSVMIWL